MTDIEFARKRSVTSDDAIPAAAASAIHILIGPTDLFGSAGGLSQQFGLPPRSPFPQRRDALLSATLGMDGMWAAAVKKAISKQVALGFTIDDSKDIATRARRAQQLYELFDGDFEDGLQRHLQDFLLCDNGAWVEIARATRGGASRVEGLFHLDSRYVIPTGDPDIPAFYETRRGEYRPLRAEFVQRFVDLPSPRRDLAGCGFCAASVAWDTIIKMQAIETYFREKVTGTRRLAIHLVSGVTEDQLREGLRTAEEDAQAEGFVRYRGSILIPGFDTDKAPSVTTIELASIADGFDLAQERDRADRIYAYAVGIFLGDIQPLTGQGLGNGQQARLLEESAEGQGLAAWRKRWTTFTKRINPSTTTFAWSTNDLTDQKRKAELQKMQVDTIGAMLTAGLIDVRSGQQLLLDAKILPAELTPPDLTTGGQLTDEDQAASVTPDTQAPAIPESPALATKADPLMANPRPRPTAAQLRAARQRIVATRGEADRLLAEVRRG